jgi:arylsulfatase A-like enzyme
MNKIFILIFTLCLSVFGNRLSAFSAEKPNVLLILADNLGYGDVQCYNPERGKIPTPHIDRLAARGLRFTDAHTSSGVCSPTRYALLKGHYHWRSRLQTGIVGYLEEPLIALDRLTLAGLLKQHGYRTAAIGKWHLGWDWSLSKEERAMLKAYSGKAGGDDVLDTLEKSGAAQNTQCSSPATTAALPTSARRNWKRKAISPAVRCAATRPMSMKAATASRSSPAGQDKSPPPAAATPSCSRPMSWPRSPTSSA